MLRQLSTTRPFSYAITQCVIWKSQQSPWTDCALASIHHHFFKKPFMHCHQLLRSASIVVAKGDTGCTPRIEYRANLFGLLVLDPAVTHIFHQKCTTVCQAKNLKICWLGDNYPSPCSSPFVFHTQNEAVVTSAHPKQKSWLHLCLLGMLCYRWSIPPLLPPSERFKDASW